jgi:hypothetical protein
LTYSAMCRSCSSLKKRSSCALRMASIEADIAMLTERTEGIGSGGEFLEREDARRGWLGRRAAEVTRVARTLAGSA